MNVTALMGFTSLVLSVLFFLFPPLKYTDFRIKFDQIKNTARINKQKNIAMQLPVMVAIILLGDIFFGFLYRQREIRHKYSVF